MSGALTRKVLRAARSGTSPDKGSVDCRNPVENIQCMKIKEVIVVKYIWEVE